MLNSVSLVGRLGQDPEAKYFESGSCVVEVTLAVDRIKKGNRETSWIPVKAWGKTGEIIANNCKKGSKIAVSGELIQESFEDNGGNKRSSIYVNAKQFEFCEKNWNNTPSSSNSQNTDDPKNLADEF